jgi:uncharacterized membrane protein YkvA (DUF1232 family)
VSEPSADKPGFIRRTLAFIGDPAVPTWRKLTGAVAAAYVILPIDLIPDFIPIFGWLDDLGVVGLVTWYMVRQINKHAEARARLPPPPPPSLSR